MDSSGQDQIQGIKTMDGFELNKTLNLCLIIKSVGTKKPSSQGLIPYIELNKYVVEDSAACIEYLSKVYQIDMDAELSELDKARSRAIIKLTENSLQWY